MNSTHLEKQKHRALLRAAWPELLATPPPLTDNEVFCKNNKQKKGDPQPPNTLTP